ERPAASFEDCEEDIAQDVLHTGSPGISEALLEHLHKTGNGQGDVLLRDLAKGVVAVGCREIGRVEVDDVLACPPRVSEHAKRKITMGIDERAASTCVDVLLDERFEKRSLAGSGLTYAVHM